MTDPADDVVRGVRALGAGIFHSAWSSDPSDKLSLQTMFFSVIHGWIHKRQQALMAAAAAIAKS